MDPVKKPTSKDIQVLLTFLSDASEGTVSLVKEQLKKIMQEYPSYKTLIERPEDPALTPEARTFLEETRLEGLQARFRALAQNGESLDLEDGLILLAQSADPTLEPERVSKGLDRLADELDKELDAAEAAPTQEITLLRRFLFDHHGFSGNERNYYDPDNSYLHRVLERRVGIPISLSSVYLLIAWRLDMEAHGIGLPGHFIVAHPLSPGTLYVDPYRHGKLLTRNDCIEIVRQRGLGFQDAFLTPASPRQILARTMANLINLYTDQGLIVKAQWLAQTLSLLEQP